ncbi:PSP-domain-containing protein [Suillus occidentalis]|nr:PSP-domain-containing protein [Suillus occidentalis]
MPQNRDSDVNIGEFETSLKEKRPGDLSPELVEALSIPPLAPPPWLISMQRFGPPPSYPTLRIPGLNVSILEGSVWHNSTILKSLTAYQALNGVSILVDGASLPLDEYNRPLYGDVFGVLPKVTDTNLTRICAGSSDDIVTSLPSQEDARGT